MPFDPLTIICLVSVLGNILQFRWMLDKLDFPRSSEPRRDTYSEPAQPEQEEIALDPVSLGLAARPESGETRQLGNYLEDDEPEDYSGVEEWIGNAPEHVQQQVYAEYVARKMKQEMEAENVRQEQNGQEDGRQKEDEKPVSSL